MNSENLVGNQSFATHTTDSVDANVSLESTFESEGVNEDTMNVACDEYDIMGKVFNTPKDA